MVWRTGSKKEVRVASLFLFIKSTEQLPFFCFFVEADAVGVVVTLNDRKELSMLRCVVVFVCGVLITLVIGFVVVPIWTEVVRNPDEGWRREISVQRHEKTGVSTVCVHSNPTRFTFKEEGEPDVTAAWKPSGTYYGSEFLVEVAITPTTKVLGVEIARVGENDAWDGTECTDEAGNRWRCVWLDEEYREIYQKDPDLKTVRRYWFGSVTVDPSGKIVFHEDGMLDNPHPDSSVWVFVQ